MKAFVPALLAGAALVWAPLARSTDDSVAQKPRSGAATGRTAEEAAQPPAAPAQPPPGPPEIMPPPPEQPGKSQEAPAATEAGRPPPGQWVHTPQYGWVWMPYSDQYWYDAADGTRVYAYYPAVGWTWVIAPWGWGPWAWGWWPWPYYGVRGYWGWGPRGGGHGWYGHPRAWPAPSRAVPAPRRFGRR